MAGFLNVSSIKAPSYHLFGVPESKLGPEVQDYLVRIDSNTLVRLDHKVGGRGVALYACSTLKVNILEKSNKNRGFDGCFGGVQLVRLL